LNKKIALAMLFVSTILLSPIMMVQQVSAYTTLPIPPDDPSKDPASWYNTVYGVLSTDYYENYPWALHDLDVGYSRYGELVNPYGDGTGNAIGLQYCGVDDPFANEHIDPFMWVQGWLIGIEYTHLTRRDIGQRFIWAYALFADMSEWGHDWQMLDYTADPTSGAGGRKTNGLAYTYDYKVLYDGPRKHIAILQTDIYDRFDDVVDPPPPMQLVSLYFTIEFNKVKKEVIIKKDVCMRAPDKVVDKLYVDFGNRGQWDLGIAAPYYSYAYIFLNQPTKYNSTALCDNYHWTDLSTFGMTATYAVAQIIDDDGYSVGWHAAWPQPQYYTPDGFYWFYKPLSWLDENPYHKGAGYGTINKTFAWLAAEDPSRIQEQDVIRRTEPITPFVTLEWSFALDHLTHRQFRGVDIRGVTDLNDGSDDDQSVPATDSLDSEVQYQLDEEFNPFDLRDAVHKTTERHLYYNPSFSGTLISGIATGLIWTDAVKVSDAEWDDYCSFSERVLINGVLWKRVTAFINYWGEYKLDPATGDITLGGPVSGAEVKVSFSKAPDHEKMEVIVKPLPNTTYYLTCRPAEDVKFVMGDVPGLGTWTLLTQTTDYSLIRDQDNNLVGVMFLRGDLNEAKVVYDTLRGRYEWIVVGTYAKTVDSLGAAYVTEAFDSIKNIEVEKAALDMEDTKEGFAVPYIFRDDFKYGYYDGLGRVALKNHWCYPYYPNPIISSNIIYVGGPAVNLGPYYMNDFLPEFWDFKSSMFVKHECWALNAYPFGALISVYKDLDGTVHLAIWGKTGTDTYYAAMWFWLGGYTEQWNDLDGDDMIDYPAEISVEGAAPGIQFLQTMNPGVTAINLWIVPPHTYILGRTIDTGNLPYVLILEKLGTISEKHPHQCERPAFEGFVEGRGPTQTDRPTIVQLPPELATVVNKYGD